jgi:hypothetical protein
MCSKLPMSDECSLFMLLSLGPGGEPVQWLGHPSSMGYTSPANFMTRQGLRELLLRRSWVEKASASLVRQTLWHQCAYQ